LSVEVLKERVMKRWKTQKEVRKFFSDTLKIRKTEVDKMLFAACHRLKSGPPEKKNIIVRFVNLHEKDKVLREAFKLKRGSGMGVSQDLPPVLARERDRLLKIKFSLPEEEKRSAKLIYLKSHPFLRLEKKDGVELADIQYTLERRAKPWETEEASDVFT